ncbi:hypothetical protein D3C85_1631620 [compost metagenome]
MGEANKNAVDDAPKNELPARAVPEARHKKGHHDRKIKIKASAAFPVKASENIIRQELGQRHMPALPIFPEITRPVRRVEVMRQPDVKEQRKT